MKNTWKESQEALRRLMENRREAWAAAQRNLSWGEQQATARRTPADRAREQRRKNPPR
jgi:hypothetical protein